jgi:hypothetical protein
MSDIYKKQVGGTHYQSMLIQPSEFINRNNKKQDLLKAKHYIDMAIDRDYPETPEEEKKQNSWGIVDE